MNHEEFAFANQQLAEMLRSGIPLEGALKRLCEGMEAGALRVELQKLAADLAEGTPLRTALPRRDLPRLYVQLASLGAQGNNLPGLLTLLADHYRKVGNLWLRLKSLMVYPVIVYVAALAVFALVTWVETRLGVTALQDLLEGQPTPAVLMHPVLLWMPVIWLAGAGLVGTGLVMFPAGRDWLRWRLPGFKEAHLARFASAMAMLLRSGGDLPQSLALASEMETHPQVAAELRGWQQRLAAGHGKPGDFASNSRCFPPLFNWLVAQSGENVADGFSRAAEIYAGRAAYRIEMVLYAALPVAILVLGIMILLHLLPLLGPLVQMINNLGGE